MKRKTWLSMICLGISAFLAFSAGAALVAKPVEATATSAYSSVIYDHTIYISQTNGNDSTGDGNFATPYATFTKAFSVVNAGDTNICLLSDYWLKSGLTGYNDSNLYRYTASHNLLITSANTTTGEVLTNVAGDFGNEASGTKVFSIYRGTAASFYTHDIFLLDQPVAYSVTFRNIIIDGCKIEHDGGTYNSGLIYWGQSAAGPLTLSTNCILQNNYGYASSNHGIRGSAIYGSSSGKFLMESNATVRSCFGGGDGAVFTLGTSASTYDNCYFKMTDNALITDCGAVQVSGNTPGQGLVIRTDFSLLMSDNAQIVNNFSTIGSIYNNETPRLCAVYIAGHGILLNGSPRLCNNFYRYYSNNALTDWYDGNLVVWTSDPIHLQGALATTAKISVSIYTTTSTSYILADAYNSSIYQPSDSDATAFYLDRTSLTASTTAWGFACNASHQINPAAPTKNLGLSTDGENPHIDAKSGPLVIPFDKTTDLMALDPRDITVRFDNTFSAPDDITDCSFDSTSKVLSVTIKQAISSSAVVKARVQRNNYIVNSHAWIDVTNNIPYTVSFRSNGGSAIADVTVQKGAAVVKPDNPTRTGYVFEAWFSDSTFLSQYVFSTIVTMDLTLYAKWTLVQKLTALSLAIDYSISEITGFNVEDATFDNYYSLSQDMSSKVKITAPFLKIDETWYGKNLYFQKVNTTEYYSSSDVLALSILARGEAPTPGTKADPSVAGGTGSLVVLSTQEYSTDLGVTWTPGTGVAISFPSGSTIYVRTAATSLAPYSKSTSVLIRSKLATPVLTANYATSVLSGLTDGYSYTISVDGTPSGTIPSNNGGSYTFPSSWVNRTISLTMQPKDSDKELASDPFVLSPVSPAAPVLSANAPKAAGEDGYIYMIAGEMYQVSGNATWTTVNANGDVSFPVGTIVTIKTAATSSTPESGTITLTIPAYTWETPNASVDYVGEKLTGLVASASYSVNGTSCVAGADGTMSIDNAWFGQTISLIKLAANATEISSTAQTIALGARPAAPVASTFTKHAPSMSGGNGTIDVPAGYEYSLGYQVYVAGPGSAGAPAGNSVSVRVAATTSHPCSNSIDLIVPNYVQPTPAAKVDYGKEVLTDLIAGASYTLTYQDGAGTSYSKVLTADSNGEIAISQYLSYAISLVKNKTKTDGTEEDSPAQAISLTGRNGAPSASTFTTTAPATSGGTGTIEVPVGYEYSGDGGTTWVKATTTSVFITAKAGIAFSIRASATTTNPASDAVSVSVPVYKQATPNAKIDYENNVLTGLVKGANYILENNGTKKTVQADSLGQIAISTYYGSTILLRKAAEQNDGTDVASEAQTIVLNNVDGSPNKSNFTTSAPTTLDGEGSVIIPADCEYFDVTNGVWDKVTKTVYAKAATSIRVRTSSTATSPASQETTIVIPPYTWYTPTPSVDYTNGLLTGLVVGGSYTLNGSVVTATNGTLDISGYYGLTLTLIKNVDVDNGTQAASAPASLSLGSSPATPASSSFTASSPVIKGGNGSVIVPKGYEYFDTATNTWNSTSGVAYAVSGTKIQIRKAATGTNPASAACEVTIPAYRWATPVATANYEKEVITGLTPYGTYTINGQNVTADAAGEVVIDGTKITFGSTLYIIKLKTTTDGTELDSNTETLLLSAIPAAPSVVVSAPENSGEMGSIIVLVGERYSLDKTIWKDVSLDSRLNYASGTIVYVQLLATSSEPASKIGAYTIPKFQWATPTVVADYANVRLTGFIPNGTYTINGTAFTADDNGFVPLDSAYYGQYLQIVKLAVIGDGTELASKAELLGIGTKPAAPDAAVFQRTSPSTPGGYGTIVIPVGYDYYDPYTYEWTSINADYTLSVKGNTPVMVRVAATSSRPFSDATTLYIPSFKWATPTASIDYKNGFFAGLIPNGTYTINGASFTADGNGDIVIPESFYGRNIAIIKLAEAVDGSDERSDAENLSVKSAPAAPAVTISAPTSSGAYGTVTLNSGMRYSFDQGANWVSVAKDNTAIFVLGNGSIYVQSEPSDTEPASLVGKLTMPAFKWATPSASVDYANGVFTNLLSKATYSINGVAYTSDKNGQIEVANSLYGDSVHIIKLAIQGDGSDLDSDAENLDVGAIPSAPVSHTETTAPSKTGNIPMKAGQEYSIDGGASWVNVQSDKNVAFPVGTQVMIRYAATSSAPASPATTLTITPYQQPTPTGVIDYLSQILTGLDAGCTYTINGVSFTADSNGAIAIPDWWYGITLSIVKNATTDDGEDLASSAESVVVLPISSAPETSLFGLTAPDSLGGNGSVLVPAGYEYYDVASGKWIAGEAKVALAYGISLRIRLAASKDAPRSEEILVSVPAYQEKTPAAVVDYPSASLTGLTPFASYSINGTTYHADKNGAIAIDYLWYGTSISVRKLSLTGDASDLDSEAQTIIFADVPAAPEASAKENFDGSGNLVVPENEEYSLDNGATWLSGGTTVKLSNGQSVMLRVMATADTPAGQITTIVFTAKNNYMTYLPYFIWAIVILYVLIRIPVYVSWHKGGIHSAFASLFVPVNRFFNLLFFGTAYCLAEQGKAKPAPEPVQTAKPQPTYKPRPAAPKKTSTNNQPFDL